MKQVIILAALLGLAVGLHSIMLAHRIDELEQSVEILVGEIKNLQHDSVIYKAENLIIYLRQERLMNWYKSVHYRGMLGEKENDKNINRVSSDRGRLYPDRHLPKPEKQRASGHRGH